jgi:D-serine deaminase-like pyridoxal phosphate-dependent protein
MTQPLNLFCCVDNQGTWLPACSVAGVADAGDEHGRLLWPQGQWQVPAELPPLGTKLLLQPGHCDPTVNLYDSIVAFRNNQVVGVWPVARGPGM